MCVCVCVCVSMCALVHASESLYMFLQFFELRVSIHNYCEFVIAMSVTYLENDIFQTPSLPSVFFILSIFSSVTFPEPKWCAINILSRAVPSTLFSVSCVFMVPKFIQCKKRLYSIRLEVLCLCV